MKGEKSMAKRRRQKKLSRLFEDDSTKNRLLSVGLSLFAKHGIADVSLRAIGAQAGSKNTGAAQYHFGDKKVFLAEILARAHDRIWIPAEQRLSDVVFADGSLREVLARGIWPMKMPPYEFDLGGEASVLLLHCAIDQDSDIRALGARCSERHLWTFYRAVKRLLPDLSEEVFGARWRIFITEALIGQTARISNFSLAHGVDDYPTIEEHSRYISALLDFSEYGFRAPVTEVDRIDLTAMLKESSTRA